MGFELLLVLILALLVIPPEELPTVARSVASFLREFRSLTDTARRELAGILDDVPPKGEATTRPTQPEVVDVAELLSPRDSSKD